MKSLITAAIILASSASQVASAPLPFPQSGEIYRIAVCPSWCGFGSDLDDDAWRKFRERTGQNIKPPTAKRGAEATNPSLWDRLRTQRHGDFGYMPGGRAKLEIKKANPKREALSVPLNPDGSVSKEWQEFVDRSKLEFDPPLEQQQQQKGGAHSANTNADESILPVSPETIDQWNAQLGTAHHQHQEKREALLITGDHNDDGHDEGSSWDAHNRHVKPDIWSKLRPIRHGEFYQVHKRDALSVAANPDGTIPKKSQEAIDHWNAQFGTSKQQHNGEKLSIPTNPDGSVSKEWQDAVNRWELRLDDTTTPPPPPQEQHKREALPAVRNANGDAGLTATSWEIYNRLPDPSNGAPHIGKLFGGGQPPQKREALPAATHPLQLSHEAIGRLNRKLGIPPSQQRREALPVAAANWGASVSRWTQEAANRLNAKLDAQRQ